MRKGGVEWGRVFSICVVLGQERAVDKKGRKKARLNDIAQREFGEEWGGHYVKLCIRLKCDVPLLLRVLLKVRYDDGRLESISSADRLVVWRAPPGEGGGGGGHYERRAAVATTPRTIPRDTQASMAGASGSRAARKGSEVRSAI